jgi:hypothetical protein
MANNDVNRMYEWYNWMFPPKEGEQPVDPSQSILTGPEGQAASEWLARNFKRPPPPADWYDMFQQDMQVQQQGIGALPR